MAKVLSTLLVVLSTIAQSNAQSQPASSPSDNHELFELEPAFPNLTFIRPIDLQHSGDGTNRLFVVEQPGIIYVFQNTQDVAEKRVFLDIRDRVNNAFMEMGLLGLAFHPNYEDNGYFYVFYTAGNNFTPTVTIARYSVSNANPDSAVHNSELILMEIPEPNDGHNGGQIRFGPDGYLYIALGDGGPGGDPRGEGQNRRTLLASLLRIDVDTINNETNYGIPEDNPFFGNGSGYKEEIYAYGLRHPWRFSFDPVTDWLWLGDVGQLEFEEINLIQNGGNYGWSIMEGSTCLNPPSGCDTSGLIPPIWEYEHPVGFAIIGGFVYHGRNASDLAGHYIYADNVTGLIWSLFYEGLEPPGECPIFS